MFRLARKNLVLYAVIFAGIFLLVAGSLSVKFSLLKPLKLPFIVFNFLKQETGALILFHNNFVRVERLDRQVRLLRYKLNSLNEIYLENQRLKKLLSFKQSLSFRVIAARVIARQPDNWSSVVIIDKGSSDGIRSGMAVIDYLGVAGRVMEAGKDSSKIMLINDPNLSVSGIVQRSRQEGLVSGTLGSDLVMRYLPEDADIKLGDMIVTSGLSQVYPKGIAIGKVIDIGTEFTGLSRYAIIRPAANISNIEELLIIMQ